MYVTIFGAAVTKEMEDTMDRTVEVRRDPDTIVTPADLRRHVLAALQERAAIGDKLAEGAIRVIAHLERQLNLRIWAAQAAAYEEYRRGDIDESRHDR